MTSGDERNFRSSYYEKVGFRNVEEKKSLDILLKDKPLDVGKLMQFCLRFTLPGRYRNLLWKVLLGVLPVHVESHSYVWEQRQEQFKDLLSALQVMRIYEDPSEFNPQLFLHMWLLETGKLHINSNDQLLHPRFKHMAEIPKALHNIFDDEVDVYWLSKGFFQYVERLEKDMEKLIECTITCLEKEDQELHSHLVNVGAIDYLPMSEWYYSCFAGVLQEAALNKIWDKLVGGSCKILVFVAVVYMTSLKRTLLAHSSTDEILDCLKQVGEEAADMIANKAIELWQQYGSLLTSSSGLEGKNLPNSTRKAV